MEEALRFFRDNEVFIYIGLGVLAIWQIRKFVLSWEEVRGAGFGLERESAQARLNGAASMLVLLLAMAMAEFVLVTFVAPTVPGALPLSTPTLDLLATPTITLAPNAAEPESTQEPLTLPPLAGAQPFPEGCNPDQVNITSPQDGETVSGVVTISGTADIQNFGFYKYEVARAGDSIWLSINASETPVKDGQLGEWSTEILPPGDYLLSLVVTDNQGQPLAPCIIRVRVTSVSDS